MNVSTFGLTLIVLGSLTSLGATLYGSALEGQEASYEQGLLEGKLAEERRIADECTRFIGTIIDDTYFECTPRGDVK
jgi:hypothetical protein